MLVPELANPLHRSLQAPQELDVSPKPPRQHVDHDRALTEGAQVDRAYFSAGYLLAELE